MTEEDLKEFLFHSMKLFSDHPPNYHIKLYFECKKLDEEELAFFVQLLQDHLRSRNQGELLMYGIDEDYRSGDFLIFCNETNAIQQVFNEIKPLVEKVSFFEYGHATLLLPTKSGGYKKEGEQIGNGAEEREDEDENAVELPAPEGVSSEKSSGCLPTVVLMVLLLSIFICSRFIIHHL